MLEIRPLIAKLKDLFALLSQKLTEKDAIVASLKQQLASLSEEYAAAQATEAAEDAEEAAAKAEMEQLVAAFDQAFPAEEPVAG